MSLHTVKSYSLDRYCFKDAYIDVKGENVPFLKLLAQLIRKGVKVRLVHAKEPGHAFKKDFDKYPILYDGLERILCPCVHFKLLIFDCRETYICSMSLTGVGMGMKK